MKDRNEYLGIQFDNEVITQCFYTHCPIFLWLVNTTVFPLLVILDMKELLYIYLHLIIHYTLNVHLISMIPDSILQIKGQLELHAGRVK